MADSKKDFDIIVIGAGIQGAGVAQAATAAGYRVAVIEKTAIAAGTSSKSSKLIHGGLRYLESAQFKLVRKTLLEREKLLSLAPNLVKPVKFYIPVYNQTSRKPWQIFIGLMLYRFLGGFKKYTGFKRVKVNEPLPVKGLKKEGLVSLFQYYDAQTDDALLTGAVMRSAQSMGAELYCPEEVIEINSENDGYTVKTGNTNQLTAKFIINAAGPWVQQVLDKITGTGIDSMPYDMVQGSHIVIEQPSPQGIVYVEAPQDRRAVFIMPWKDKTLVGTTEKKYSGDPDNAFATQDEIDYLKEVYRYYMDVAEVNVQSSFAGLRVLPVQAGSFFSRPRDTIIKLSAKNFLSLYGGKLTGYRITAEQVVSEIKKSLPIQQKQLSTEDIRLS